MARSFIALLCAAAVSASVLAFAPAAAEAPSIYLVGTAERSIDTDADATFAGQSVHIGGGSQGETADYVAEPGLRAHAIAISASSSPDDALVLALIDNFGQFVAYEQGPWGLIDIRRRAAEETGIDGQRIIIQSSHSHRSPDVTGFWGGVPDEWLSMQADRAVAAIVAAWDAIEPATLHVASIRATELQLNDYRDAMGNEVMDRDVRVLQARRSDGAVLTTMTNLSAHSITANGMDGLHPDWPALAGDIAAARFGGDGGFGIVGAIGRVAPERDPSRDACPNDIGDIQREQCVSEHYAGLLVDRAEQALRTATPLMGDPTVAAHSYLFTDASANPIPQALFYVPDETGLAMDRSTSPPWQTGTLTSSIATVATVGDVAFVGFPGEAFPSIFRAIEDIVPAQEHFAVGLANDMLGYIAHPFPTAYPEVLRRAAINGDPNDPTDWHQESDDKLLFNLSPTFGEQLTCNLLRGFGELHNRGLDYWHTYGKCAGFQADLLRPAGSDVSGG